MKVVIDTNVLVSGLLTPRGPCGQLIELLIAGALEACVDGRIIAEYAEVVRRGSLGIPRAYADEILGLIQATAEPVAAKPLPAVLPDKDDVPFLEVAATAGAILVTGNKRHFPKSQRAGAKVVSAGELLDLMRAM